jgi:branched-chain amino acid transport system permease protein
MLAVATLSVWLIYFVLLKGKWGRAFIVLRDAEISARSLGVNEFKYKLLAFALSAALTGVAGGLYTSYVGFITPSILGNEFFLMVMVMLCVGGMGRFPGVLLGAFAITLGNEYLRDFGQYRLIILGLAVIVTLLFLPNGVVDLPRRRRLSALSTLTFRRGR